MYFAMYTGLKTLMKAPSYNPGAALGLRILTSIVFLYFAAAPSTRLSDLYLIVAISLRTIFLLGTKTEE